MDYDALTAAQKRTYHDAVSRTHHREVEFRFYRVSNGDPVASLTNLSILGASVNGDASRTPCEVLEADILDEAFDLDWTHGQHRHYKVRVTDSRFIPDLDDWVSAVVFTGPLWTFDRKGPEVHMVAHGAERLAMGSVRHVVTRSRKARATDVIHDLFVAAGANAGDLSIPKLKTRLPERVTVGVRRGKKKHKDDKRHPRDAKNPKKRIYRADMEDVYYPEADRIANALNRDLFPDARGRFCLRSRRTRPTFELTASTILTQVGEKPAGEDEVTNTWEVYGADPKGPKKRVHVTVALPAAHSSSAEKRNWNGTPRRVTEVVENKHLKNDKQARELGQHLRDRALRETVEYEVEALPVVPWLRPMSLVTVPTGFGKASMIVRQWTLPLGPGADALVIGANRSRGWRR